MKATHLQIGTSSTACGLVGTTHHRTHNPGDVDCYRCKRTRVWQLLHHCAHCDNEGCKWCRK